MQHDDQVRHYGEDSTAHEDKRVGYLHPLRICESQHTFRVEDDPNLKGKTEEEAAVIKEAMKKKFKTEYTKYLARTFCQFKDRNCIVAPYNFK